MYNYAVEYSRGIVATYSIAVCACMQDILIQFNGGVWVIAMEYMI